MIQYLLDANVFIQAKRFHYPFDAFPGFWDWLKRDLEAGLFGSIVPIYHELIVGNDELVEWTSQCSEKACFLAVDDEGTQKRYAEIATWVIKPEQQFKQTAYEEFLSVGDSWLIAKALSINATIVTHERFDANCKKRVLIPNVCKAFGIEYIDTLELIRRTGVKFGIT